MKKVINSLESLEYDNLYPVSDQDRTEIEKCFAKEIEVTYEQNDLRVYNEAGTWIADLEKR